MSTAYREDKIIQMMQGFERAKQYVHYCQRPSRKNTLRNYKNEVILELILSSSKPNIMVNLA